MTYCQIMQMFSVKYVCLTAVHTKKNLKRRTQKGGGELREKKWAGE